MQQFKVLLVEDSRTQALRFQFMLQTHGFEAVVVGNGREALDRLKQEYFPIIITDWVMPEMDGVELCQAIRSRKYDGYVFIFLVTSKDDPDDIVAGLQAGADDYLTKPVSELELMARLNTAKRVIDLERSLKKRNEEVLHLSVTDALTEVHNRSYFNTQCPSFIARAVRSREPVSCMICDVDHFKQVNDTYGHLAGDRVLQVFAGCLKEQVRQGLDLLVRYGGEEFVVILSDTDSEGAITAAERMRQSIAQLSIPWEGNTISITASFGVVSYQPASMAHLLSVEQLMSAADEALYSAKEAGRNCIRHVVL
nr:diguanylate cyclase [uncultured Desulfuromonas sp.]